MMPLSDFGKDVRYALPDTADRMLVGFDPDFCPPTGLVQGWQEGGPRRVVRFRVTSFLFRITVGRWNFATSL